MLDGASYFCALAVTVHKVHDGLEIVRQPSYRPDLNFGEYWLHLEAAFDNRFLGSLYKFTTAIDTRLDQLLFLRKQLSLTSTRADPLRCLFCRRS